MNKSRHQSLYDFLQALQLEYVSAELRSKIYTSNSDKRYYKRVMSHKKEKIEDISLRNDLNTIFTDDSVKKEVYALTHTKFGIPTFVYRNDEDKAKFEESDLLNYFSVGSEVKIQGDDESVEIGIIVDAQQFENKWNDGNNDIDSIPIVVKKRRDQNEAIVLVSQISRIL